MLLSDNEVRIVYSNATAETFPGANAYKILSESEILKYERFHFADDKLRFLKARYILRTIASAFHNNCDPQRIQISLNSFGKPFFNDIPLHFSITHSGQIAAVAFSKHFPVGIDIELKREISDMSQLAKRFFAEPEVNYLKQFSGEELISNFFRIWSSKEAYIKATGLGVSKRLKSFSTVHNNKFSKVTDFEDSSSDYKIMEVQFGIEYTSAVCILDILEEPHITLSDLNEMQGQNL
jgi:4'-phosphopantetheinyl transferase